MEFSKLIADFAERFNIADLDAGDGSAMLEIDGMEISIVADEPGDALVVAGVIGDPPPENAATFADLLLQTNHDLLGTEGCGFAQNQESGAYVLILRLAQNGLDIDAFCKTLDSFVNKVESWRKLLADFRPAAQAAAEAGAEAKKEAASGFIGGGFMPV